MTEATKTKRKTTPMTYLLCSVQKDAEGNITSLNVVPQPPLDKPTNSRTEIKRAVKKALEKGQHAEHYNGRQLTIVGFPAPFCFKAEVETIEVRKVNITES